jgi:ribose transport system ATP-binding protein
MAVALLTLAHASKSFGGIRVVKDVDLEIRPGEVIALLGENGAGKSTLLKMIAGVVRPDSGELTLRGVAATIADVRAAQSAGIVMVHQELNLTDNQSVQQNIFLGREPRRGPAWFGVIDRRALAREAQRVLDIVGSTVSPKALVGELSIAQQQQVEIAKALSQPEVSIMLLDEPTSSLPEEQANELLELISSLRDRGLAVVITTHRMDEAFAVADRVVVMRDGTKVIEFAAGDEGMTKNRVIQEMVGRELTAIFPDHRQPTPIPVLEVAGLSGGIIHDVSFEVRRGEIFGLGGLVGAGRTETVRRIFGADRMSAGSLVLNGQPIVVRRPLDAVRLGIGFVPEDRKTEGLVQMLSVRENIAIPNLRSWTRLGFLSLARVREAVRRLVAELSIKVRNGNQPVLSLSGGNQQKVVLAKWMAQPLKLLILDEPTRGVDVGARAEIYRHIDQIAAQGVGVLLVSSDMEELIGLSDRIGVMAEGRLRGILEGDRITQGNIMTLASQLESIPSAPFPIPAEVAL